MKYARRCDVTGHGMNSGYVWEDGIFYTKDLETTLAELRKDRSAVMQDIEYMTEYDIEDTSCWDDFKEARNRAILGIETDDDLLTLAHLKGMLYYTEWDCPEDCQYEEVDGKLIELDF